MVNGCALAFERLILQNASFQEKMIRRRALRPAPALSLQHVRCADESAAIDFLFFGQRRGGCEPEEWLPPRSSGATRANSWHSQAAWRVMAEPFKRWVIEDHFINGRPRSEEVGVPMTSNVLRTKR
jgi:hypothetical protein